MADVCFVNKTIVCIIANTVNCYFYLQLKYTYMGTTQ